MGTILDKLNKIITTKEAIRTAINSKGGTLTESDTFASYSNAINSLPSGGGGSLKEYLDETKDASYLFCGYPDNNKWSTWFKNLTYERLQKILRYNTTSNVTNMQGMFYHCWSLTAIPSINTSLVTDMSYMFSGCWKLTTIPSLNTSQVTDMRQIFSGCSNLITIPQLDTSKVTNMYGMFSDCSKLTTIPQLDTGKVTDMGRMFYNCSKLTTIPSLDTSKVTDMMQMFYGCWNLTTIDITHMNIKIDSHTTDFARDCYSLTKLIIRNMDTIPKLDVNWPPFNSCYHFMGKVNADYNPEGLKDGRIYVPDDKVEALKTASVWNKYADIIVPLSLLDATEINDINVYEDEKGNIINIDNLSYEEVQ